MIGKPAFFFPYYIYKGLHKPIILPLENSLANIAGAVRLNITGELMYALFAVAQKGADVDAAGSLCALHSCICKRFDSVRGQPA